MKNDRELLELAAKASGYFPPEISIGHQPYTGPEYFTTKNWNPLTDDGDALRLAAKLRLKVIPGKHLGDGCTVEAQRDGIAGCTAFDRNPAKQMRTAIVLVAAEIGRAMP